jgi:hypothetical protein
MSDSEAIISVTPEDGLPTRLARRLAGLRTNSAAICVMLLAEYGLGMGVNLYLRVPQADQHHGLATAVGRALTSQPAALAAHAGLGLLMLVAGVSVLTRATLARHRPAIAASAAGLAAIAAAAVSGASYASAGHAAASMAMAILTGVALLCYLTILFTAGSPAATSRVAR